MSTLDRAFAYTQHLSHFSFLKLIRLDYSLSDHCPLLVCWETLDSIGVETF